MMCSPRNRQCTSRGSESHWETCHCHSRKPVSEQGLCCDGTCHHGEPGVGDGFLSCRPGPQTPCLALDMWGLDCLPAESVQSPHIPAWTRLSSAVVSLGVANHLFLSHHQAAYHPSGRIISVISPAWSPCFT